ncbi:WD G-beta repeat-containing protein, putative [Babesia ovata]|uniref:WD G-beta repeat-containing protein, putative n=1 Tax=Babesia ovata TaxID=189622 RepID=A0A2H6KDR2_9APIC|nr:WD G-beta repeat-containing protein, putative [Babesia ovata]GBE61114.1 WD G-beta repeat-containing protein, putative [Babesia ovata]
MKRERSSPIKRPYTAVLGGLNDVLRRYHQSVRAWHAEGSVCSQRNAATDVSFSQTGFGANETIPIENEAAPSPESATSRVSEPINALPDLLGGILYDFGRVMQHESSRFDAFDVLYRAMAKVRNRESAVKAIKHRRRTWVPPVNVYHQLLSRRMGRRSTFSPLGAQQLRKITKTFKRAANVWGHHCCLDEIDPNKPYNEPPQVRCIRFDKTGDVLITGGDEGIIKLWHTFNCTLITSLRKHAGGIVSMDVHPNNYFILSCCDGGEMWLWEINGNLYRPHKRVSSPFKYLWCRFASFGGSAGGAATGFSDRCEREIDSTLVVCVTTDSRLSIYRMRDLVVSSSGNNVTREVSPLYVVELFNHNIKAYDVSRPLMHDHSFLIAIGIEPMFLEELRLAEDTASSALSILQGEAASRSADRAHGQYGKITSNALCALFNISTGTFLASLGDKSAGKDSSDMNVDRTAPNESGRDSSGTVDNGGAGFCLCDVSVNAFQDTAGRCRCCLKPVRTFTFREVPRSSPKDYLSQPEESSPKVSGSKADTAPVSRPSAPKFCWKHDSNELETYIREELAGYSIHEDSQVADSVRFGTNSMPFGRLTSTVVFPSYMDTPYVLFDSLDMDQRDTGNFDDLIYHVQRGHELSPDVCFANHSLNHVTGSDDGKAFLWVHCGSTVKFKSIPLLTKCINKWVCNDPSETSTGRQTPDVLDPAFVIDPPVSVTEDAVDTRTGISPVTAPTSNAPEGTDIGQVSTSAPMEVDIANSEDDMTKKNVVFSNAVVASENVTGSELTVMDSSGSAPAPSPSHDDTSKIGSQNGLEIAAPVNGCLRKDAITNSVAENEVAGSSDHYRPSWLTDYAAKDLDTCDAFLPSDRVKPSMRDEEVCQSGKATSKLFKEGDSNKQHMSESGHHYMVTAISWSVNDTYIFIADSIVTRFNVKKLITASRTILSGVSVFTSQGLPVADFLHNEISHHVGCVKPHPLTDDLALVITYGGVIYVLSVESKSVVRKLDCGPNAVWLDADWHPCGMYFAACQSFGCFSLFTVDGLLSNYRATLNHQCGYSDMLPINTSAFYSGAESDSVNIRRYHYGSTLMPPLELDGKGCSESLRFYTASSFHTVLDDNRCEVLYACSPVPMQVDDTKPWGNRLLDMSVVPAHLWSSISVLSRIPLDINVVEFLQWHLGVYGNCDVAELLSWFLCVNKLDVLGNFTNRVRRVVCPYGGVTCVVCQHIVTSSDRAERYAEMSAEQHGVKSKVNERGDIIACLPIASRPQSSTAPHPPAAPIERRPQTASPTNRVISAATTTRAPSLSRTQIALRSNENSRSSSSLRHASLSRQPPTRVQPPRGAAARPTTSASATSAQSSNDEVRTRISPRRNAAAPPATASPRTPPASDRATSQTQIGSSDITRALSQVTSDERTVRRLRREMRMTQSSDDESSPDRVSSSYPFRNRRQCVEGGVKRELDRATYLGSVLGSIGLSKAAHQASGPLDAVCLLCGFGSDNSKAKRNTGVKAYIGGSTLVRNSLIGPFAVSKRYMDTMEQEFPKLFDRMGNDVFMHIGCLAAATHLVPDSSGHRIANLPEVLIRGMHEKCAYCGGTYATLHCTGADCNRAFHYTCSIACVEDESYQRQQPTLRRNPSFWSRMNNPVDPLLCDRFLCLECTLKDWIDGSPSVEPLCTGEHFLSDEPRAWFYSDARDMNAHCYVPQGGDLIFIPVQARSRIKANSAIPWSSALHTHMLEVKKVDYRFCGPISDDIGICSVLWVRQMDNNKRQSLFYRPGDLTVLTLVDVLVGVWRLDKVKEGDSVKVLCADGWMDATVSGIKDPLVCSANYNVVSGDYSTANVARLGRAAIDLGTNCIQAKLVSDASEQWFSAWQFRIDPTSESSLFDSLHQRLFPAEAMEDLINLTLDGNFEEFNILPKWTECRERWVRTYWTTIACPMSMEKVRQRILNSYYMCPQGCLSDLDLIVRNCRLFNPPSSTLCQIAQTLERAISTIRDDIRRLMNAEKYAKVLVQFLRPNIGLLFVTPSTSTNAVVGEDNVASTQPDSTASQTHTLDADIASPASARGALSPTQATQRFDDDDMPIRRSPRILRSKASVSDDIQAHKLPQASKAPLRSAISGGTDDSRHPTSKPNASEIQHGHSTRASQKLGESDQVSSRGYANSAVGNTSTSSSSLRSSASSGGTPVQQPASNTSTSAGGLHMTNRRTSSRLAAINEREAEQAKIAALEKKQQEEEEKLRRTYASRYNLRGI